MTLTEAVDLVSPALGGGNQAIIYSNLMFTGDRVCAYNDVLGISAPYHVDCAPFRVYGHTLIGLLQATDGEPTITVKGNDAVVTAGKSIFKLPLSEEEAVFAQPEKGEYAAADITDELLRGIEICLTTSCIDSTMPAIMGLCFNPYQKAIYSCDGDAITRYTVDVPGDKPHTLPNAFCEALISICAQLKDKGTLAIGEDWAHAMLEGSGVEIYGRIIQNDDPLDHQTMIEQTVGRPTFVDVPKGLAKAMTRARVLSDKDSSKTVLDVVKGNLKISTENYLGSVKDVVPLKGHKDVTAAVHAQLVARGINICDQIAILQNATAYALGDSVLMIASNIGE